MDKPVSSSSMVSEPGFTRQCGLPHSSQFHPISKLHTFCLWKHHIGTTECCFSDLSKLSSSRYICVSNLFIYLEELSVHPVWQLRDSKGVKRGDEWCCQSLGCTLKWRQWSSVLCNLATRRQQFFYIAVLRNRFFYAHKSFCSDRFAVLCRIYVILFCKLFWMCLCRFLLTGCGCFLSQ